MRPALRRTLLLSALTTALVSGTLAGIAALATPALAAAPIALDAPENGTGAAPLVAYDPTTQTTYVVWADPTRSAIDLCILPAGATVCEGGAPVLLEDSLFEGDNFAGPAGLVVLPGGEVAVIGNTGNSGSIAWISPAGGGGFLSKGGGLQNKGEPISAVSLYYSVGNAAALSSTDVGLLDDYFNHFGDTSLTSESPEPPANTNPGGKFPRKSLETAGPEIAAEPAPAPAPAGTDVVVGVGDNYAGPPEALPGCLNKEGTGFGVSAGNVDGTSKAAGTLNAEGLPAYGVLACSAETPVLAQGGTDGIGLVEQEGDGFEGTGSLYNVDYRPFVATSTGGAFGAPVELADVTHESLDGVINLDLSEDSGTGVYTTWQDEQGLLLDYSANGGAAWEGPTLVPEPPASGPQGNPVIVGTGDGNAEIAYVGNPGTGPQVFLQAVNYAALVAANITPPTPAADTLATSQTSGTTTGASITISAGTVGETDRATLSGVNAASATGTVTYGLFSNPSCTSSSEIFKSGAVAVTSGVGAPSTAVTSALSTGSYYWLASYSGDANNVASVSACGSEVLKVVPATTVEGGGTTSGGSVTVTISCASTPCTVTITITIGGASKASVARKKKNKPKTIVLATGTFTITTPGPKKLTVRLTKAGKQQLRRDHGHLKAGISVSEKTAGGLELTTKTINIVTVKPKHKHKK